MVQRRRCCRRIRNVRNECLPFQYFLAAIATLYVVGWSVHLSGDNEFQEVFPNYQTLKMVLLNVYECSIVKVKQFNILLCFLISIAALETVICVSQSVINEFQ